MNRVDRRLVLAAAAIAAAAALVAWWLSRVAVLPDDFRIGDLT